MAKPGQRDQIAATLARGRDLSKAKMSPEQIARAHERLEMGRGLRCSGCGRRITIGFRFTSIAPLDAELPIMQMSACNRDDCNQAEALREGAVCMEMVEFAWLDDDGAEARPAIDITERREKIDAARAAAQRVVESGPSRPSG